MSTEQLPQSTSEANVQTICDMLAHYEEFLRLDLLSLTQQETGESDEI